MNMDKDKEYSISISMTPAFHDNEEEPYFWVILLHSEHGISNSGCCGWAKTHELAWEKALKSYNTNIK